MGVNAIPTKNALQSTLSSTLSQAETTSFAIADDWSTYLSDVSASRPIIVCIDRVDSNGLRTPSAREYVQAVSVTGGSGTTFTTLTRAKGGSTQQAHSAGAIVELVVGVDTIKSITDGFLVDHNADGTHNISGTLAVSGTSSTSAEIRLAEDTDNGTNYIGLKAPASVGTSKTFILPDADGSANQVLKTDGSANWGWATASILSTTQYAPEGFLINGKIVPSVASNNLTVAIKGMDGNDPSASNPVYVRIGDTVRTITSALSVTKNAGTNWCNAGGSELATLEADYFVYLGYNATDGVVIGFSRIPFANVYSDFSATTTHEKYCAISTITNAAAGDNYTVIGRFGATLSAGAGYTWTVPSFTTANLIQRPIYESRILTYDSNATGFTGAVTDNLSYQVSGQVVRISAANEITGTSNATTFTFALPFLNDATQNGALPVNVKDNGTNQSVMGHLQFSAGSKTVDVFKTFYGGVWTNSGTKSCFVTDFSFRIDV